MIDRVFALRIVRWQFKLSYILVSYLLVVAIVQALALIGAAAHLRDVLVYLLYLVAFLYGARIFRGADEAVEGARPLWKMTSKPRLSRRLGIFFVLCTILLVVDVALVLSPDPAIAKRAGGIDQLGFVIPSAVFYGVLAILYLNSGVRLKRLETK